MPERDDAVDLVINVWEHTYERIMTERVFSTISAQTEWTFRRRILLINNVNDHGAVGALADQLIADGEITEYYWVHEHLADVLPVVGLTLTDLGRIPHYSDCVLVAAFVSRSPWLLYWDAEFRLERAGPWIADGIDLLESSEDVFCVQPGWTDDSKRIEREIIQATEKWYKMVGFTDHCFLVERSRILRPIYGFRHLASKRYPLAHVTAVFEQRVDSYMRCSHRYRYVNTATWGRHPKSEEGRSYPSPTFSEKVRRAVNVAIVTGLRVVNRIAWRYLPPSYRI